MQQSSEDEDIRDDIVEGIENSEVGEVVVVIFACLYLGASQLGYIAQSMELTMLALAVIGAAVGVDSLHKKLKRHS